MDRSKFPTGLALNHDPALNKGSAFTQEERDAFGLRGLLPPRITTLEQQVARAVDNVRHKPNSLEQYIFLTNLLDRNETVFYRVLLDNLTEMMPIIYTPTVGQACLEYGHIFRRSRGLFISINDRGYIGKILDNWRSDDVRVIVVTDGERILGLGDLGAHGMGIPIGKLALYTTCAGIDPSTCLPVMLDTGTNNQALLNDPLYIGLQQKRVRGPEYDELFAEFVSEVQKRFPSALIQLEDFGNDNAFRLLHEYRDKACLFDDDIQGTGAVALAGLFTALRITGKPLTEQNVVFLGAGEASLGIGEMIVAAMIDAGMAEADARRRCWFVDSKGLVVSSRHDLNAHKRPFAHDHAFLPDLLSAVETLKPTAIIGAAGQPNTFTPDVIKAMARFNERPIIFAMSNPTSKQECSSEDAYYYSDGRAIFASGSPSPTVEINGQILQPGQGNNAYIFPGVGLGIVACGITRVTDEMFLAAAHALADFVSDDDLAHGKIYPSLSDIREVSVKIAIAVANVATKRGLISHDRPTDLEACIRSHMYQPVYRSYL